MKIALIGYGKMGKAIEQVIQNQSNGDEIVLRIGSQNMHEFTNENLQQADVAIEFTQPEAAFGNIKRCLDAGIPVVVGTTAWLQHLPEVKLLCSEKNGAVFFSPNYSIGVNIFWAVNKKLAALMGAQPQYSVTMEEIHHTEKKDAPSGTAVKTAEVIIESYSAKKAMVTQLITPDQTQEIPTLQESDLLIVAKREPNVPGTHTVTWQSNVDVIQLTHEAKSRMGFAEGAVAAARWLQNRKGYFTMQDMLGF